jgi:hypothetical protein
MYPLMSEWALLHIWNLPITFIMSKYLVTKVDVAKMWEVVKPIRICSNDTPIPYPL